MDNSKLTDLEEKFCLVYACGPSPYNGNAKATYALVFKGKTGRLFNPDGDEQVIEDVDMAIEVHNLMRRSDIRDYIDKIQSENVITASTLRPRLTVNLLKIADECATDVYEDRFGVKQNPASLRSVAVNAISKLMEIYGVKEDIAHKVMLEGAGNEGITFNLIMPESNKENELAKTIE